MRFPFPVLMVSLSGFDLLLIVYWSLYLNTTGTGTISQEYIESLTLKYVFNGLKLPQDNIRFGKFLFQKV